MSFDEEHHRTHQNMGKIVNKKERQNGPIPSTHFRVFETIIPIESNFLGKSCLEFSYSFVLDTQPS